jgi:ATP-binding cassette subfamily F protein uup
LFAKNPDRFAKLAAESERHRAGLAKAEDEWLELEMLKAEMES